MGNKFNFGDYLLEQGFAYTNYGDHQLYEKSVDGVDYAVNIQEGVFTHNKSGEGDNLKVDVKLPKTKTEAEKWLKDFKK